MRMLLISLCLISLNSNRCAESSAVVEQPWKRISGKMTATGRQVTVDVEMPAGSHWQKHWTKSGQKILVEWLPRHDQVEVATRLFEEHWDVMEIIYGIADFNRRTPPPDVINWQHLSLAYQIAVLLELKAIPLSTTRKDELSLAIRDLYDLYNDHPLLFYLLNRARDRVYMQQPVRGMVKGLNRPWMDDCRLEWSPWNESEA